MTTTLWRLLVCAAALGGIAAGMIMFDLPRPGRDALQAVRRPLVIQTPSTRALVPHWVARDRALGAIKPGAQTVDINVYARNITKAECAALMNAYAWRAGTGRVAVWQPGSGPSADAAGSNIDHNSALCLCHFDRDPPECYFHLPLG